MKVQVKLYTYFAKYCPGENERGLFTMELVPPVSVGELLQKLGIPPDYAKVVHVNGKFAKEENLLKDGDFLAVFPPLPGG
jgi:sulfur carrier protein ThiS